MKTRALVETKKVVTKMVPATKKRLVKAAGKVFGRKVKTGSHGLVLPSVIDEAADNASRLRTSEEKLADAIFNRGPRYDKSVTVGKGSLSGKDRKVVQTKLSIAARNVANRKGHK